MRYAVALALGVAALGAVAAPAWAWDAASEARAHFDQAELAREEGRLEEASDLYRRAIEAQPSFVAAHAGYLAALRGIGDYRPAKEFYADLVAKNPDLVDLKAFQAAAQPAADAVPALEALSAAHPDHFRVHCELGRAQIHSGDVKGAERSLKAALRVDADSSAARLLLADIDFLGGGYFRAAKEYEAITQSDPTFVPAKLRLALARHRMEKTDDALSILGTLVAEENLPRLVAAHWIIAFISVDRKDWDAAVKAMDKVLAVDKDDFQALIAKGQILLLANKPTEATKVFEQATQVRRDSGLAFFCLGWAHEKAADAPELQDAQRKEKLVAAAEAYTKCSEMDPGVRPRDSLGFVYLLSEKHGEAVTQFKRAIDIDPDFAPSVNNLGLAQDMADNRVEAKKRYEQVLKKIDKKNVRSRVMLALDLWLDGSAAKAIKELTAALKIAPEDDLAWTFLGDIHYDSKKVSSAISAYRKAVEINDRNFMAWYHMGIAYDDDKRKNEDADKCYRKALEAKPDPPVALVLRLAEINEVDVLNRPKEALKFYQLYVDLGGKEDWVPARIEELKEAFGGDG